MSLERKAVYIAKCECGKEMIVMRKRKATVELEEKGWSFKDGKIECADCKKPKA